MNACQPRDVIDIGEDIRALRDAMPSSADFRTLSVADAYDLCVRREEIEAEVKLLKEELARRMKQRDLAGLTTP